MKEEEIYCREYGGREELRANVEEFLDQYYYRQRLHSALGYQTPEEFERSIPVIESNEPTARWIFRPARRSMDPRRGSQVEGCPGGCSRSRVAEASVAGPGLRVGMPEWNPHRGGEAPGGEKRELPG